MSCPRPGEKCYEFMCGSSIEGICTNGSPSEQGMTEIMESSSR